MDFQTDAVTQAVPKMLLVAGVVDNVAGYFVYGFAVGVGTEVEENGRLRPQYQIIDLPKFLAWLVAQIKGARHIAVIAAKLRPHVDHDAVAQRQHPVARPVVGQGAVGAGSDDDGKGGGVGPGLAHCLFQLPGQFPLRLAGAGQLVDLAHGVVGQFGRCSNLAQFGGGFYLAQRLDCFGQWFPFNTLNFTQLAHGRQASVLGFNADLARAGRLKQLLVVLFGALVLEKSESGRFVLGLLVVAGVGGDEGGFGRYQQLAAGARKAAQPAPVAVAADQHPFHFPFI